MNIKNKFLILFILISSITLAIININNPEKTKYYLFTKKIEDIPIGKLITFTFISGFIFGSSLTLISKNNLEKSIDNNFIEDEKIDQPNENVLDQEFISERPPERDIRESQPTISVNYRFVDQENDSYISKNSKRKDDNIRNNDNDWITNDNDW